MKRILFLDIDGVFIPTRMYFAAEQTKPIVTKFCPSVVGMVNDICVETGARWVIHSSWLCTALHGFEHVHEHMIAEGLLSDYYEGSVKYSRSGTRWDAIADWLRENECDDYYILDDEEMPDVLKNHVWTSFPDGFTYSQYLEIIEEWTGTES